MIRLIRALVIVEAATFLIAGALHLGVSVPLASVIGEPLIPQAGGPESVIGLVLVAGAVASFLRGRGARWTLVGTLVFAILGTLVGISAINAGLGPRTDAGEVYHRVILALLVVTLALTLLAGRAVRSLGGVGRPA